MYQLFCHPRKKYYWSHQFFFVYAFPIIIFFFCNDWLRFITYFGILTNEMNFGDHVRACIGGEKLFCGILHKAGRKSSLKFPFVACQLVTLLSAIKTESYSGSPKWVTLLDQWNNRVILTRHILKLVHIWAQINFKLW